MEHRFQKWLGLTDDQLQQIKALRGQNAGAGKQVAQDLRAAQKDLRQAALNGADPAMIQAKETKVQGLMGQMVQLRVKRLQDIAPILTPEQRQKLAQSDWPDRWHGRGRHERRSS
jgi:Spy/CpxP family protein refolding chaperone